MGPPVISQAPFIGEHSRRFCTGDLGMDPAQVDALIESGALEALD
jgi:hypothetical protein